MSGSQFLIIWNKENFKTILQNLKVNECQSVNKMAALKRYSGLKSMQKLSKKIILTLKGNTYILATFVYLRFFL